MQLQSFQDILYICEFLLNGQRRSVLLRPVDAANGVVLDGDEAGRMFGQTSSGQRVELPINRILRIERYKVQFRATDNGRSSRTEYASEKKLEKIIERRTDKETGEVKGIAEISDTQDDSNRAEHRFKWQND